MVTKKIYSTVIIFSFIAVLTFFLACEKMEQQSPTAIDNRSEIKSLVENPIIVSSSGTLDIIVTTTSDIVDFEGAQQISDLPGPDGVVSLQEAIWAANNTPEPQTIGFNIPTSDLGFNGTVFTIQPYGNTMITDNGTTIDGSSQALFSGDTNPLGPEIVVDGSIAGVITYFHLVSDNNSIIGLVLNNMKYAGINIGGNNNRICQCYIGVDETGTIAKGNEVYAVEVVGSNNRIENNLISGNKFWAVSIHGEVSAEANVVQNNFIGTDRTGTKALGNVGEGVQVKYGINNIIKGNLISGGNGQGIVLNYATGTIIQGNLIGTDITGTRALGNADQGINIADASNSNIIGGTAQSERNIISGNPSDGIFMMQSNNNRIIGNYIGTDITGKNPIPNNVISGGAGLVIVGTSQGNVAERNLIAFNMRDGILVDELESVNPINNTFSKNSIFSNEGFGIDLSRDGVTPNDRGDTDTGDNNLMNYPVLTSAKVTSGKLHVKGTIDTQNPKMVTIEFFANPVPTPGGDPSGYGEGAIYLGSDHPNPHGKINATLPTVAPGTLITATATDAAGNTSEFSAYIEAK